MRRLLWWRCKLDDQLPDAGGFWAAAEAKLSPEALARAKTARDRARNDTGPRSLF